MLTVEQIVTAASAMGASDIHIVCGLPPKCRLDGELKDIFPSPLTDEDCDSLAREACGADYDTYMQIGELDLGSTIAGRRCRLNIFRQQGHSSIALRILSSKILDLSKLGVPKAVNTFSKFNKGIVLVCGETGSGKSTTLAAILDEINHTQSKHIVTMEDPIEYIYQPDKCIFNQREIGRDTRSFADALRAVLREDPDVILVGELRDPITIETALTAAETGHLVFATLHTNSAVDSVERIVGSFSADRQAQIRTVLSSTLQAVLAQQLLRHVSGHGRVLAAECMVVTPAIRNLIREGKTPMMMSAMLSSAKEGSLTMDNCLINLVAERKISPQMAYDACADKEYIKKKLMLP